MLRRKIASVLAEVRAIRTVADAPLSLPKFALLEDTFLPSMGMKHHGHLERQVEAQGLAAGYLPATLDYSKHNSATPSSCGVNRTAFGQSTGDPIVNHGFFV